MTSPHLEILSKPLGILSDSGTTPLQLTVQGVHLFKAHAVYRVL